MKRGKRLLHVRIWNQRPQLKTETEERPSTKRKRRDGRQVITDNVTASTEWSWQQFLQPL